jgi:hypothetical protein
LQTVAGRALRGHQFSGKHLRRVDPAAAEAETNEAAAILHFEDSPFSQLPWKSGILAGMPLDPKQRHRLLIADRTRDPDAVTAVIAALRNENRGPTLAEIEDALRAAAGVSYLIRTAEGFEVVIGFAASRRALAKAGITPEQNRAALAGK